MRRAVPLLLLAACKGSPYEEPWCSPAPTTPAPSAESATWHADIAPLFAERCGACHVPDGHAPFAVDSYAAVAPWIPAIRAAVADRSMPPWLAAECCTPWFDDYSLSDDEIARVLAWADAGGPEGDPETAAPLPPAVGGLSRVDLTLTVPEPYTPHPPAGSVDDTHCFVLDWPEAEARYVTGLFPSPGNHAIVHHLIVGVMPPSGVADLLRTDAETEEPGFDCSGGLGDLPGLVPLGGSLTGGDYPRGLGTRVEGGGKIVLQVHYSVADGPAGSDQTSIQFKLDDVAVPASAIILANPGWLVGRGMLIPAGDADVAYWYRYRPTVFTGGEEVELQGVTPHMHRYASRMRVLVIHADESSECLLEIPDWSFGWEQAYWFAEPKRLRPDDEVYIECHFDNSAANQPDSGEPRDIAWGDQDQDMCAAFIEFTQAAP